MVQTELSSQGVPDFGTTTQDWSTQSASVQEVETQSALEVQQSATGWMWQTTEQCACSQGPAVQSVSNEQKSRVEVSTTVKTLSAESMRQSETAIQITAWEQTHLCAPQ